MDEENLQVINNQKVEELLKRILSSRVIDDDLFEEKIIDLLEPYPDISKDRIDEVLLYYTLKVAAERVSQFHKSKGYTESTLTTYESFNPKLRHLYIAGNYKSVFDLNISNPTRLSAVPVNKIEEMLKEITVPKKPKTVPIPQKEDEPVPVNISAKKPIGTKIMNSLGAMLHTGEHATGYATLGLPQKAAIYGDKHGKYAIGRLYGIAYLRQEDIAEKNIREILLRQKGTRK